MASGKLKSCFPAWKKKAWNPGRGRYSRSIGNMHRERLPLIPNAETIAAMKEARTGNLARFDDVESLIDDLHEGD